MIDYFPRSTLAGIAKQFYRNGRYRIRTSLKHRRRLGARQLAPIALAATISGSSALGIFAHPVFLAPTAIYAIGIFISATFVASSKTPQRIALIALSAVTAHLAFGAGALSMLLGGFGGASPLLRPSQASVQS
jgi:hypothetical protein